MGNLKKRWRDCLHNSTYSTSVFSFVSPTSSFSSRLYLISFPLPPPPFVLSPPVFVTVRYWHVEFVSCGISQNLLWVWRQSHFHSSVHQLWWTTIWLFNSSFRIRCWSFDSYPVLFYTINWFDIYYTFPPIIRCGGKSRTTPMTLAKRMVQTSRNFACLVQSAKSADAPRRFSNFFLEAEIWIKN